MWKDITFVRPRDKSPLRDVWLWPPNTRLFLFWGVSSSCKTAPKSQALSTHLNWVIILEGVTFLPQPWPDLRAWIHVGNIFFFLLLLSTIEISPIFLAKEVFFMPLYSFLLLSWRFIYHSHDRFCQNHLRAHKRSFFADFWAVIIAALPQLPCEPPSGRLRCPRTGLPHTFLAHSSAVAQGSV